MVSAQRPGPRARCTHHGGATAPSSDEREDDDDRADDQDQEGRRPVADVEAGEVEPAGAAALGANRTQPANRVCAPQRGHSAGERAAERRRLGSAVLAAHPA